MKTQKHIYLDPKLAKQLATTCKKQMVTQAHFIRQAIIEKLKN